MANFPVTKWWNIISIYNVFNNHYEGMYQTAVKMIPIDIQFTTLWVI